MRTLIRNLYLSTDQRDIGHYNRKLKKRIPISLLLLYPY